MTTFSSPLFLCCNLFHSNYYPLNREEILRKLRRKISEKSANVSMNKALINTLQPNRAEKVGGRRRGKKILSGTAVNEEIPQEEQQPGPLRQCNNLAKSSNDETTDEEEEDFSTAYRLG